MYCAVWNDNVLAESKECEVVDGEIYFPPNSLTLRYYKSSSTNIECPTKGKAYYYHLNIDGEVFSDSAFYYSHPKKGFHHIKNYVTFKEPIEIKSLSD